MFFSIVMFIKGCDLVQILIESKGKKKNIKNFRATETDCHFIIMLNHCEITKLVINSVSYI